MPQVRPAAARGRWLATAALLGLLQPASCLRLLPARQANASDELPGGNVTLGLYDALKELSSSVPDDRPVCLAVSGNFVGRLSNTVSMFNMVAVAALNASKILNRRIVFKFPQNYTAWMKKEGLEQLFGTEPVCPEQDVQVYRAHCVTFEEPKHRCNVGDMAVNMAAEESKSSLCGCSKAVLVPAEYMLWIQRYQWTHTLLSERYWQGRPEKMEVPGASQLMIPSSGASPRQAVMHVRLGDVENNCSARYNVYNCKKRLKVDYYVNTVQALMQVLPPHCFELNIVTDGQPTSPDILAIQGNLSDAGLAALKVWTASSLDVATTFHFMTHADVLIYGSSGYGQLAGVLAKSETARLGNPLPPGYQQDPLFYLPNTTQLRSHNDGFFNMTEAVEKVKKNTAIQAYARECRSRSRTELMQK